MAISARPDISDEGAPSPWVGQRMTLEEFLALPEQKPALEYDEGVVTPKMAPTPDHVELQAILRDALNEAADEQRHGRAFLELRFVDGDVAYVPDVGYYRRARLHTRPGRRYAPDLGLPDIAVEIVSPNQSMTRQIQKCLRYVELGAEIALLVHPDDEAVLAFRAGQPPRVQKGDDRIDVDDVLPGFPLTVRALFQAIVPDWLDEEPAAEAVPDATGRAQADEATAPERSDG